MQATAHFLIWTLVLQVLIRFALAYLINKKFRGNDLWTTVIVLPMMLSPAVVGNFWTFLYKPQIGLFNYVVGFFLGKDPGSFSMIADVSLDAIAYPPKVLFSPSLEGYVNLFTTQTRASPQALEQLGAPATWYDRIVRDKGMVIAGPSRYGERFLNSVVIGFGSTFLCMVFGTAAAYAFSRFRVPAKDDLLFFILSTRTMPPIAVAIPIFLMFRTLGLSDTHLGMILLYAAVNLSLSVWLLSAQMRRFVRGLLRGRRGNWEMVASALIATAW